MRFQRLCKSSIWSLLAVSAGLVCVCRVAAESGTKQGQGGAATGCQGSRPWRPRDVARVGQGGRRRHAHGRSVSLVLQRKGAEAVHGGPAEPVQPGVRPADRHRPRGGHDVPGRDDAEFRRPVDDQLSSRRRPLPGGSPQRSRSRRRGLAPGRFGESLVHRQRHQGAADQEREGERPDGC